MPVSDAPPDFESALLEIERLEKEIAIAVLSDRFLTAARLALSASSLLTKFNRPRSAVSFDDSAVKALEMLPFTSDPSARATLVRALKKSGMSHLLLGHFAQALDRLQSALRLVDDSVPPRVLADLHWDASVLAQWRHEPVEGLDHALSAWEYYGSKGDAIERSRLRVQIAQLAMDAAILTRSQGAFTSSHEYLRLAEEHVYSARPKARSWFAPSVDVTALLAFARFKRLANRDDKDRTDLIEYAIDRANRLHDVPVQGQAVTALGDELAALGHRNAARNQYVSAFDILSKSSVPGLALLPWREILREQEFRDK